MTESVELTEYYIALVPKEGAKLNLCVSDKAGRVDIYQSGMENPKPFNFTSKNMVEKFLNKKSFFQYVLLKKVVNKKITSNIFYILQNNYALKKLNYDQRDEISPEDIVFQPSFTNVKVYGSTFFDN